MSRAGLFAAAAAIALALGASAARADTAKAWAAAKANAPADAKLMIGIDVAALRKTQVVGKLVDKMRQDTDTAKLLDTLKTSCKLDPLAVISGVVVAMTADHQAGAVYFAITGTDRTSLSKCLQAAAAADKGVKLTVTQDGNITQLTKDSDNKYFGWLGKDVVVVSNHTDDKAALAAWMTGKGELAKSDLTKVLAKVNTKAAVWGAGDASSGEVAPGVTAKYVYGAVTDVAAKVGIDVHAIMASASDASSLADMANGQLGQALAAAAMIPPAVLPILQAIKIAAASDEVVIKANLTEQQVQDALSMMLTARATANGPDSSPAEVTAPAAGSASGSGKH